MNLRSLKRLVIGGRRNAVNLQPKHSGTQFSKQVTSGIKEKSAKECYHKQPPGVSSRGRISRMGYCIKTSGLATWWPQENCIVNGFSEVCLKTVRSVTKSEVAHAQKNEALAL